MKVYISTKQIKRRGNLIAVYPHELRSVPGTLREFIAMLVSEGVSSYNQRLLEKDHATLLTNTDMDTMSHVGKIGFGIPFGSRPADLQDALQTAFRGFEDGLYRIFIREQEIESLDASLCLKEEDTVTIIRLVMLTGGYF